MKFKRRKNSTQSVIWRLHGNLLSEIFFCFLICDLLIAWGLFPKELLSGINSSFSPKQLPYIIESIPSSVFYDIYATMRPLLAVQLVYLMFKLMFGSGELHRIMAPLTRLVETTKVLSQEKHDEEIIEQLENAVKRIDHLRTDEKLHIGNSELIGLEQAINRLLDRMRTLYSQQTRFVSDASHELRTPISVIQGYVNLLDRWGKEDPQILEESIAAIKSESEHMQKLIEQLLFLARSDSGRNPITFAPVNLAEIINEIHEEYAMICPSRIWKLELSPEPLNVSADKSMIKQAARILCDNAVKYSPEGSTVTIRAYKNADTVSFSVQDEGIGISQEDQAHIFERFYRADPSRVRATGGTGLGLSIAQWIVERHNGTITVLSREDIGTRMTVTLKN